MRFFNRVQSEDLPHESGIKTALSLSLDTLVQSEDLPHESGIKTYQAVGYKDFRFRRKTCPTNRGLRLKKMLQGLHARQSEDLPHESGIKT